MNTANPKPRISRGTDSAIYAAAGEEQLLLLFNDPDEDFAVMLDAYRNGTISGERMQEALTRILGLKAHMGLHRKKPEQLVPSEEAMALTLRKPEYRETQRAA